MLFAHHVEDRGVLDICAGTNADVVYVAADYRAGPNTGVVADGYVADDYGGGVDVGGGGDFGPLAAIGSDHAIPLIHWHIGRAVDAAQHWENHFDSHVKITSAC